MNKVLILVGAVIVVGAALYFIMMGNKTTTPAPAETVTQDQSPTPEMKQTISLAVQNESSESGTAVLTEKDGKTVVTLTMNGAPVDVPQPAHIHTGSCPNVGAVVYPLNNLVNGMSETTLNVTLAQLAAQQPLGINVHKSVPEVKVYVSCGDLAIPTSAATNAPAMAPATTGQTNSGY